MRTALVLVVAWLSVPASAQSLSFDDALAMAEDRPDVRGARAELRERRRLDRRIRRVGGNPQIYLQPGWRTAPTGEEGLELQAQLTQQISLAGVGRARRSAARAERAVLDVEARGRALAARLDAARAWIALWASTRRRVLLEERRALVERWQTITERAHQLGASTRVDAALVVAERGEVAEREAANQVEMQRRSQALAAALNAPSATLMVEGQPPHVDLPPVDALASVDATLPASLVAEARVEQERARLAEVRASAGTTISLGGQFAHDSPGGVVVSGILSATLPIFERNQRGRAVQRGALARAEVDARGAIRDARRLFAACVADLDRARRAAMTMRDSTVPALGALATAYARRREAGEALVFEELAAQRRWLDARTRAIEIFAAETWSEIRVRMLLDAMEETR